MIHFEPGDSIAAQVELQRHPFQGPDKLGRTLKCGTWSKGYEWTYIAPAPIKQWKPSKTPTAASTAHVEMSQRTFRSEGMEFTFWSLAPVKPGLRSKWQGNMHHEFVWLVDERGWLYHALIDPDTATVYWHQVQPAGKPQLYKRHDNDYVVAMEAS